MLVYIDLSFYDELKSRFGASGDFAQASNPGAAKQLSVQLELQADCLAGVWGHSTNQRKILESGDVEDGLNAAAAIGDDNIQKMQGGRGIPARARGRHAGRVPGDTLTPPRD